MGFNNPAKGSIFIGGKNVTNLSTEKRGISMVFQSYALFPTMNVYENIAFGLKVQNLPKDYIDKKVRVIADKVHIHPDKLYNNVSELSGGQQQRVAIARALVLDPKILCLDEPLSNLDVKLRDELRMELKRLQKELKITTIYVTHDQEEALSLSDRIAVFNKGKIEQVGTPFEIYNRSKCKFVCEFIGEINKVEGKLIQEINNKTTKIFRTTDPIYFRFESLSNTSTHLDDLELMGKVLDTEYTGSFTKITYEIDGTIVKNLEKNTRKRLPEIGEKIKLYLHPEDIMQFGDVYEN